MPKKLYSISSTNHIATIIERPRKIETLKAFKTAINDHFNANCTITTLDLKNRVQYIPMTINNQPHTIRVSETSLY